MRCYGNVLYFGYAVCTWTEVYLVTSGEPRRLPRHGKSFTVSLMRESHGKGVSVLLQGKLQGKSLASIVVWYSHVGRRLTDRTCI
eukprot:6213416-Pleurochrysis_carterae.AAC.6